MVILRVCELVPFKNHKTRWTETYIVSTLWDNRNPVWFPFFIFLKQNRWGFQWNTPPPTKKETNAQPRKADKTACLTKPLGRRGGESMRCFEFPLPTFLGKNYRNKHPQLRTHRIQKNWGIPFFLRCSSFCIETMFSIFAADSSYINMINPPYLCV